MKKIINKTNNLFNDNNTLTEFHSTNSYFKVIIYNANYKNASEKLNKKQEIIYLSIKENPSISRKQLIDITKKDNSTITRNINTLKEKGFIERVGSDRDGYWKILR